MQTPRADLCITYRVDVPHQYDLGAPMGTRVQLMLVCMYRRVGQRFHYPLPRLAC